jgi:hypothetical protein
MCKWATRLDQRFCLTKKHWCNAKWDLRPPSAPARLCTAATRSLTGLSAFLDVSSLNLAVPRHRHFFVESRTVRRPGWSGSAQLGQFGDEGFDQEAQVALDPGKARGPFEADLVHVKIASNFNL